MNMGKCPNCNIEIDSNVKCCPFCGGKFDYNPTTTDRTDVKWIKKWGWKLKLLRTISGFMFGFSFVLSILIFRIVNSVAAKYISGALIVVAVLSFIVMLLSGFKHFAFYKFSDRYYILVYRGFFSYLVIEGKVAAKKFMGILPIKKDNILDPSSVCLFLNSENVDIDEVSKENLKGSKDLLARLPNNKKVLAHFDGKNYELMEQVDNK